MKKVFALFLTIVMVCAMSVTSFAVQENFVNSPSTQPGPVLDGFTNLDEGCTASVIVTPYSERDTLDEATRKILEDALKAIVDVDDLTELCNELAALAQSLGIPTGNLAVSDLFDLSFEGCDDHQDHRVTVNLKAEALEGYVSLMHLSDGVWTLVSDVTVNGNTLTFTSDSEGPYAIVVNAGADNVEPPQTGDEFPWHYVVLIAVCVVGLGAVGYALNKKKA